MTFKNDHQNGGFLHGGAVWRNSYWLGRLQHKRHVQPKPLGPKGATVFLADKESHREVWVLSLNSRTNCYRRKFRSQTSDNMDRWKAEMGRVREKRRAEERRCRCAKRQESHETLCFFQWFVAPEGRKVGSLKRRVRSHLARWEMKNCTPLCREAHSQVKKLKTLHIPTTFGSWDSWDVEKVHAIVARSTCWRQKTPCSDHFWKLWCRKSARCCGAKHFSKSKCTKHTTFVPLLEVQMSFRVAGARDCAPC